MEYTNTIKPTTNSRIEVIDALRGFAVMAILLVHNLEHFIFPVYPESSPAWLGILDQFTFNAVFTLFAGKAYAIFALLFGFTFYIQMNNQAQKQKDFGYRFLWRMVMLAGFGCLNALFFPAGNVLLMFSAVSIILFLMRHASKKWILVVSIFFLFQPVEWFYYFYSLFNPDFALPDLGVGAMYAEVARYTREGSLLEFFWGNLTLGQKASFYWAINAGRIFQTAGLFLLGFYLGKRKVFSNNKENIARWVICLIVSALLFAPLNKFNDLIAMNGSLLETKSIGIVLDMWQKLAFTGVLVSSFILLYTLPKFQKLVSSLRPYGKMSLTNYISQSVAGFLIYFPFTLYLAPYCGYTVSLLIGVVMFILQVMFSKWWLSKHKQGPLEMIWHKWTWLPFSRK